jgi:hypothetical protein
MDLLQDPTFANKYRIFIVEFDAMKVNQKKNKSQPISDFDIWKLFFL